ncbi:MAG: SpoIID/LytB domain-containing protein, partial [Candidatus Omnitrophica bacterium]|nr:SpoIID/LytB domain-containing protein [Candidatus Omnitrophota bacterium]
MIKRLVTIVWVTVIGIFLFSSGYAQDDRYVRVSIMRNEDSVSVKVGGFYQIKNAETGEIMRRGRGLRGDVAYSPAGFSIAKTVFKAHKIFIKSDYPEEITVNGRKFSGGILLAQKSGSNFSVINYIRLEDYVKGVLYHEVSHYWPIEVLKAQAVVCRSFALYQMQANKNREFDVTNDIYSQVYGGRTSERYRTSLAVDRTKGIVLTYNGKILPAYFHSTCGGRTEDASVLWHTTIVPLKGVECGFCKESPHFKWIKILSPEE